MSEHADKTNGVDANQHTEDILRRSQEWLQAMATNAPVGIYLTDLDRQCLYANQKWCDMAGMRLEEALGNGWINALHPDDRERVNAQWYKLSLSNWNGQQEYRFQAPNGKVTWVSGYASEIKDERDYVVGYLSINMDISARKSMEAALRASEERYRTTIDAMSDGIHVVDQDLKITMNNSTIARWAQEMGLSGILVGKTPFKVFPFLSENVVAEYRRVFQTGKVLITEEVSRYGHHKEMHTETRKIPILENGEVAHVATVIRDISEQVKAEKALKESEERFRSIYDQSPVAIELYDENGLLIDANPACLELFGVENIDKVKGFDFFADPNLPDEAKEAALLGKTVQYEVRFDFDLVREMGLYKTSKSGTRCLDFLITPWLSQESKPTGFLVHLRDITKKKSTEKTLRRQAQELKALQETVLEVTEPHELSLLLPIIVERAIHLVGGTEGGLYLTNPDEKEVHCVVSYNNKRDFTGTVLKYGEGAAGTVAQSGKALIIDDYRTWSGRAAVFEDEQPFVSILSVPLKWQNQVTGVLHVLNDAEGKTFSQADQELLSMFAAHAAMAVGKEEALEQAAKEIAERKIAERALASSEKLYRSVLTSISDAVYITDKNQNFTFVCENTDVLFGYTQSEVEKMGSIIELLGNKIVDYEEVCEQGEISNIECEVVDKSGDHHSLLVNVKLVDINEGKMLFTCHDITERKQAEDVLAARLRISEFAAHHSQDDLLQLTLDEAEQLTGSSIGFLHFVEDDQITLHLQMWSTNTLETMCTIEGKGQHYPVNEAGVWADCLLEKKPIIHNDYASLAHKKGYPEGHAPVTRELTVPVIVGDKVKAIIGVGNKETEYDENDVKTVSTLAHMVWDIVIRKQAEDALQKSEQNLQAILDANLDLALLIEPDGQIVTCNETVAKRFGRKKETLVGTNTYDLVDTQVAEYRRGYAEQVIAKGEAVRFEDERNGRIIDNSISPVVNDSGQVVCLALFGKDITEQKHLFQELQESKRNIQSIFDTMSEGIALNEIIYDENGEMIDYRIMKVNPSFYEVADYLGTDVEGNVATRLYGMSSEFIKAFWKEHLEKNATAHTEIWSPLNNKCYYIATSPFVDDKFVTSFFDITERKQIETKLEMALEEAQLRQKETMALLEAAQAIPVCTTFKEAAHKIFDICKKLLGAQSGYVALLSEDGMENEVLFLDAGGLPCNVDPELPMPIRGLREIAYKTNDVAYDNNFFDSPWMEYMPQGHMMLKNVLFTPLNIQDKTVGLIGLANKPGGFTERDAELAKTFGNLAAVGFKFTSNQDELRNSEERYRLLAENSTDGIILYSPDYVPLYLSPSLEKLTGYPLDEFEKYYVFDLFHPEDRERVLQAIQRDVQQKKTISKHEFRFKKKDDSYAWFETIGNRSFNAQGEVTQILVNVREITERKQAEEKNRESEERYRNIYNRTPIMLHSIDRKGKLISVSDYWLDSMGYERDEVLGRFSTDFLTKESQQYAKEVALPNFFKQGHIKDYHYQMVKKNGEILDTLLSAVSETDQSGNFIRTLAVITDITKLRQTEREKERLLQEVTNQREELRTLNARVAEGDEIERRRIANELHDQIGQNLSALSINLNIIQNNIPAAEQLKQRIDDSLQLVDETADSIRNVMADLHPIVLDDYGLVPTLKWLADRVGGRTGLQVDFKSWNLKDKRLEPKVEMNLFRITQEALSNASRHARAKRVMVELKQLKHVLRLSVADDGIGFDVTENYATDEHGWGLRIMRERAKSIGGKFRVEGEAGEGSKVIVELDS